jgi:ribonuclease BN (tRNA processing enzyme)
MCSRPTLCRALIVVFVVLARATSFGAQQPQPAGSAGTADDVAVVFLGTGFPAPDPERQGPALAIVINGQAYLVDAGSGIVRQASAAFQRGMPGLQPRRLDIAFLTHLHSDHTLGLPDLILTPWIVERTKPLRLYGPSGTKAMASHILEAFQEDIDVRTTGLEKGNATGYKVDAHDVRPGTVYQDDNVTVKAFLVPHGSWTEALGYRFESRGKAIVVSGDTAAAESVVEACNGCDVLIHEVYWGWGVPPDKASVTAAQWMMYMRAFHTSASELGGIAARAKAKTLILTHWMALGNAKEDELVREIRGSYNGPIVIARDLDVFAP